MFHLVSREVSLTRGVKQAWRRTHTVKSTVTVFGQHQGTEHTVVSDMMRDESQRKLKSRSQRNMKPDDGKWRCPLLIPSKCSTRLLQGLWKEIQPDKWKGMARQMQSEVLQNVLSTLSGDNSHPIRFQQNYKVMAYIMYTYISVIFV